MREIFIIRLELQFGHRLEDDSEVRRLRRQEFVDLPAVARSYLFLRHQCDFRLSLGIELEVGAAHIN